MGRTRVPNGPGPSLSTSASSRGHRGRLAALLGVTSQAHIGFAVIGRKARDDARELSGQPAGTRRMSEPRSMEELRASIQRRRSMPSPEMARAIRRRAGISQATLGRSIGRQPPSRVLVGRRRPIPRGDRFDMYLDALYLMMEETNV